MRGRRNHRSQLRAVVLLLGISALAGGALVASAFAANPGAPTVITGTPKVGGTLTSSSAGDSALYQWQRCNPSTATCAESDVNDSDWSKISGANTQTFTLTAADLGFLIRVLSKDTSLGTQFAASSSVGPVVAADSPAQEIAPQHGVFLVGNLASGKVQFKPPGQGSFSPLDKTTLIPVGSIINARHGVITLLAATGVFGETTPDQAIQFYEGIFKIKQAPETNSIALAKLVGKPRCGGSSPKSSAASASGGDAVAAARRKRRLWGRGSGSYGTAGRGGTGSVVGTTWLTVEKCAGTFFQVSDDPGAHGIEVDAKGKKKPVFLGPGESYLAER